jgi:hypothetical protein
MRMTIVALIAMAAAAFAQGPPPGRGGRERMGLDGAPGGGGPMGESGILRAGVKNAPFSADVVTESTRTLADGNHIRQTVNSKVYRDSEGRTRREQAVSLNGLAPDANMRQMVFINDPVGGVTYSLNAQERTGTKTLRNFDGRGPQRTSLDTSSRGPGANAGPDGRQARMGGVVPKTESLGRQAIEGVQAEGRRTTMTIPAGQAGNELPIHIVVESWYSADLQTTVLARHSDPRNGETVTRLMNISRSEPAHLLFEAPADYKVSESAAGMPRPRGGPGQSKQ